MWKQETPIHGMTAHVASPASSVRKREAARAKDVVIGKSIIVKGELDGGEDVTVQGQVEGRITVKQHVLTIGTHARIRADLFAKSVVIQGEVTGTVGAIETVSISAAGAVDGDIRAPRVIIADGARFRGSIDMQPGAAGPAEPVATRSRASASASPGVGSESR